MNRTSLKSLDLLMGIDIGSTNIKCALYGSDARLVCLVVRPTVAAHLHGLERTFDAEKLWELTLEACADAVNQAEQDHNIRIRGIAVSSVGCSSILLDKKNQAVHFDVADDERLKAFLKIREKMSPGEYFKITGYPLEENNTAFFLAALNIEQKRNKVDTILSVADYINFRLTGIKTREYSTAVSMALWDYRHKRWWNDFLEEIGLNPEVLGMPAESAKPIGFLTGAVADALRLPKNTMVYTGGHDYLCAALACNVAVGTEVLNVTGTWEIMASFSEDPEKSYENETWRCMKDYHVVPGQYSYMIEAPGAYQIEWLRNNMLANQGMGAEDIPALEPYFSGLKDLPRAFTKTREIFIPRVFGQVIPKIDIEMTGAYFGLTSQSDGITLFRATIEGLSFQTKQIYDQQRKVLSKENVKYTSVGGGSRNAIWNQLKADILNTPVHVPRIKEASALGAALLSGVGSGVYMDFHQAGKTADELGEDVFEPRAKISEMYQEIYKEIYLPMLDTLELYDKKLSKLLTKHNKK